MIIGQIFDVYGPCVLLVVGTILIGLSLILTSVLTKYYQLMNTHGVIFGTGSAMLYTLSVSGEPAYSMGADALISHHHRSRLLRTHPSLLALHLSRQPARYATAIDDKTIFPDRNLLDNGPTYSFPLSSITIMSSLLPPLPRTLSLRWPSRPHLHHALRSTQ